MRTCEVSTNRGNGFANLPEVLKGAEVYAFRDSAFVGLPWPKKIAGRFGGARSRSSRKLAGTMPVQIDVAGEISWNKLQFDMRSGFTSSPQEASRLVVRQATVSDVDCLTPLFDGYRQFYRQPSELGRIRKFLLDRFEHNQSVIFIALKDGSAIGFTQLYPSFSSGALERIYILNDLFVDPKARREGAGTKLLEAAAEYGRLVGALRLVLSTELTNTAAQALYERFGWKKDGEYCTYQLWLRG